MLLFSPLLYVNIGWGRRCITLVTVVPVARGQLGVREHPVVRNGLTHPKLGRQTLMTFLSVPTALIPLQSFAPHITGIVSFRCSVRLIVWTTRGIHRFGAIRPTPPVFRLRSLRKTLISCLGATLPFVAFRVTDLPR